MGKVPFYFISKSHKMSPRYKRKKATDFSVAFLRDQKRSQNNTT